MKLFHVTMQDNVAGILANGLLPSKSGLDGPGVYLWRGPLEDAIREADLSLSDVHSKMSGEEYEAFTKQLVLLAVEFPDDVAFSVEWPEYVVFNNGAIPQEWVTSIGSLYSLLDRFPARQSISELISDAKESTASLQAATAKKQESKDFSTHSDWIY